MHVVEVLFGRPGKGVVVRRLARWPLARHHVHNPSTPQAPRGVTSRRLLPRSDDLRLDRRGELRDRHGRVAADREMDVPTLPPLELNLKQEMKGMPVVARLTCSRCPCPGA